MYIMHIFTCTQAYIHIYTADCRRAECRVGAWHSWVVGTGKRARSEGKGQQNPWQYRSDWQLADKLEKDKLILLLPVSCWSGQHEPEFESAGWWQKPTCRAKCKKYEQCEIVKELEKDFHGGASDIVKAKSSGKDPRETGGLVSNLSHPRVNKTKQHTWCNRPFEANTQLVNWEGAEKRI